jgi:hypothetical protein
MSVLIDPINIEDLNDILFNVNYTNQKNFSSFKKSLNQICGIAHNYDELFDYLEDELELHSDADLENISEDDKDEIVQFLKENVCE